MRATTRLLKHTIKFVGGPHPIPKPYPAKAHPFAPNGIIPGKMGISTTVKSSFSISSYHNANPVQPQHGEFFARSELPERFRYKPVKDFEMEQIISGGAEIVY
ncbi:hypothetical protein KGF56_003649 [Candida oxycetoniae]|uniref:37S ribosomal protein YMR-31, mitochondrial n=1 Tax=Candida oxycetoniae TaxID=497107 RepID=A0AAI9SVH6_9ASCO|nr:uncharacterized protein KGF56_003649 [Candida oxycetoniae]KAI3403604.1 hypothetical protein KGF56_003649 [Candida oxycetoniae]